MNGDTHVTITKQKIAHFSRQEYCIICVEIKITRICRHSFTRLLVIYTVACRRSNCDPAGYHNLWSSRSCAYVQTFWLSKLIENIPSCGQRMWSYRIFLHLSKLSPTKREARCWVRQCKASSIFSQEKTLLSVTPETCVSFMYIFAEWTSLLGPL